MKTKSILSSYMIFVNWWLKKLWSFLAISIWKNNHDTNFHVFLHKSRHIYFPWRDISILSSDSEKAYPKIVENKDFVQKFPLLNDNEAWNWIKSEFFVVDGLRYSISVISFMLLLPYFFI